MSFRLEAVGEVGLGATLSDTRCRSLVPSPLKQSLLGVCGGARPHVDRWSKSMGDSSGAAPLAEGFAVLHILCVPVFVALGREAAASP